MAMCRLSKIGLCRPCDRTGLEQLPAQWTLASLTVRLHCWSGEAGWILGGVEVSICYIVAQAFLMFALKGSVLLGRKCGCCSSGHEIGDFRPLDTHLELFDRRVCGSGQCVTKRRPKATWARAVSSKW